MSLIFGVFLFILFFLHYGKRVSERLEGWEKGSLGIGSWIQYKEEDGLTFFLFAWVYTLYCLNSEVFVRVTGFFNFYLTTCSEMFPFFSYSHFHFYSGVYSTRTVSEGLRLNGWKYHVCRDSISLG